MSPVNDMPSRAALDAAVKPTGMTWDVFDETYTEYAACYKIALAYAADLDKADKQNREVLALLDAAGGYDESDMSRISAASRLLRANLLPEPQPTLWDEFEKAHPERPREDPEWRDGAKFALDWIAKRELAKEQDRG